MVAHLLANGSASHKILGCGSKLWLFCLDAHQFESAVNENSECLFAGGKG